MQFDPAMHFRTDDSGTFMHWVTGLTSFGVADLWWLLMGALANLDSARKEQFQQDLHDFAVGMAKNGKGELYSQKQIGWPEVNLADPADLAYHLSEFVYKRGHQRIEISRHSTKFPIHRCATAALYDADVRARWFCLAAENAFRSLLNNWRCPNGSRANVVLYLGGTLESRVSYVVRPNRKGLGWRCYALNASLHYEGPEDVLPTSPPSSHSQLTPKMHRSFAAPGLPPDELAMEREEQS